MIVLYILWQPFFNILQFFPTKIDLFYAIIVFLFFQNPILRSLAFLQLLPFYIFLILILISKAIRRILPKTLIILHSCWINSPRNPFITPDHSNANVNKSNQILFRMQKDIWNGSTYHRFRPDYNKQLLTDAFQPLEKREKYLDLATGTGKILFTFCEHFQFSKGIDFNEHMLNQARTKAQKHNHTHPQQKILIQNVNIMNLAEKQTFDFITIGAALHYVTGETVMQKIWNTLNPNGIFVALCYNFDAIRSEQFQEDSNVFKEFLQIIKPYYVFSIQQVQQRYTNQQKYPFEKFFSKVERKNMSMEIPMLKQEFIELAKTFSPVNIYKQKHGVDPTKLLQTKLQSKLLYIICDSFRVKCFK